MRVPYSTEVARISAIAGYILSALLAVGALQILMFCMLAYVCVTLGVEQIITSSSHVSQLHVNGRLSVIKEDLAAAGGANMEWRILRGTYRNFL